MYELEQFGWCAVATEGKDDAYSRLMACTDFQGVKPDISYCIKLAHRRGIKILDAPLNNRRTYDIMVNSSFSLVDPLQD